MDIRLFFVPKMALSITEKRRIALAYDGSEDARKLFEWSLKNIIRPETDHLILLSAVHPGEKNATSSSGSGEMPRRLSLPMLSTSPSRVTDTIEQASHNRTAQERLESMAAHLRTLNISSEEHILWGDAKVLIPRFTQHYPVELLIVGSRGLGTMKTVFLGSVSDRCIHECPCPVLVVRHATI